MGTMGMVPRWAWPRTEKGLPLGFVGCSHVRKGVNQNADSFVGSEKSAKKLLPFK